MQALDEDSSDADDIYKAMGLDDFGGDMDTFRKQMAAPTEERKGLWDTVFGYLFDLAKPKVAVKK